MEHRPTSVIYELFANNDPESAWGKAVDIIKRINPEFDFSITRTVFDDVVRLYHGDYPGYCPIKTPYHDLPHTLDVFLCAIRLAHGEVLSGNSLSNREITLVMAATLFHDVGYAQLHNGEETGTGAQYTKIHVTRSIEFMRRYLAEHDFPADLADNMESMIYCSDPLLPLSQINFPDERIRLLGQIVGTADLVGQMADRNYLEKLSYLYEEFEEGNIGNYQSMYDLICKTNEFYAVISNKLDHDFGSIYNRLPLHFKDTLSIQKNYYMESIEKNMAYLQKLVSLGESNFRSLLRRGGIIQQSQEQINRNYLH